MTPRAALSLAGLILGNTIVCCAMIIGSPPAAAGVSVIVASTVLVLAAMAYTVRRMLS